MIKFSVIIPIYKVEKYLNQCVDSVLQQNFIDFEIILVNDGSPDNCPQICDEYVALDERIRVIHKLNEGLSSARNEGLIIAKGEYVIFLDSDDYWSGKENLLNMSKVIENNQDLDVLLFKRSYLYENSKQIKPSKLFESSKFLKLNKDQVFEELINKEEFDVHSCLKVLKRTLLIENELYFKKGITGEDIEWYLRVLVHVKSLDSYNDPFYVYRAQRPGSITNKMGISNLIDMIETIEERFVHVQNKESKFTELFVNCYKSYLAYQLTIIIGYYSYLDFKERERIKKRILKLIPILKFDMYKKTKYIFSFYKIMGLILTSYILGFYIKLRKKGKISL